MDCDTEVARQPVLVRIIKSDKASKEFGIRIELIETHEVSERERSSTFPETALEPASSRSGLATKAKMTTDFFFWTSLRSL